MKRRRISMMKVSLWRHYSNTSKSNCTIYARILYDGQRAELGSTGIHIQSDEWDTTNRRVLSTHPQYQVLNEDLADLLGRIDIAYQAVRRSKRPISAEVILQTYRAIFEPDITPESVQVSISIKEVFQRWVNHREEQLENRIIKYPTFKKNREAKTKFLDYLSATSKEDIPNDEFNIKAAQRYRAWLEKQGYGYPHINKLLKTLRQAVRWAFEEEITEINPLEGMKLKREKLKPPVFLFSHQVENLKSEPFQSEVLQRVADVFVIYCRTGFHYSDLKAVIKESKPKLSKGFGFDWIYHDRIKTGVTAKVPLFDEIRPIVAKYGGWDNLPLISNQKMNEYLKVIAAARNLPASLSVKVGRNTLADWLLNEKGWSREAVKVVMGIRTDSILARYVRADERRVILELNKQA